MTQEQITAKIIYTLLSEITPGQLFAVSNKLNIPFQDLQEIKGTTLLAYKKLFEVDTLM